MESSHCWPAVAAVAVCAAGCASAVAPAPSGQPTPVARAVANGAGAGAGGRVAVRPGWDVARGVVFDDENGNGVRDPVEAGVAGALVSNGVDVARADNSGAYRIPIRAGQVLFVVKPSNYAVPTDADMLPQFFYVHQPEGTPAAYQFRYPGLAPTGPLPERIDFPLLALPEPSQFRALLIADPQPQTDAEVTYVRDDFVAQVLSSDAAGAAFGITHGDIMFDDLSLLPRYNAVIGKLGVPWYNVPGNHELNFRAPDDAHSLDTFKRFFGPTYYAFEYAGVIVLALDNVVYHGFDPQSPNGSGGYHGSISTEQLAFVKNLLPYIDPDKLVVVSTHIPLYAGDAPGPGTQTDNREALFELLCGRRRVVAFAGHTHASEHRYFEPVDGCAAEVHHHVLATVSGAWWSGPYDARGIPAAVQTDGTPNGYYVLEVDGATAAARYVPLGHARDHQMRIVFEVAAAAAAGEVEPSDDALAEVTVPEVDAIVPGPPAPRPLPFPLRRERLVGEPSGARLARAQLSATRVVINVFDGGPRTRVIARIDDRSEEIAQRVLRPDPLAAQLYSEGAAKKPWVQATPSPHLWELALPSDLAPGAHRLSVTVIDETGDAHRGARVFEVSE